MWFGTFRERNLLFVLGTFSVEYLYPKVGLRRWRENVSNLRWRARHRDVYSVLPLFLIRTWRPGSSSFLWVMTGLRSTTHIICHHQVVQVHISLSLSFSPSIYITIHILTVHPFNHQNFSDGFKKEYFSYALPSCVQDQTRAWCTRKLFDTLESCYSFHLFTKLKNSIKQCEQTSFSTKNEKNDEEKSTPGKLGKMFSRFDGFDIQFYLRKCTFELNLNPTSKSPQHGKWSLVQ